MYRVIELRQTSIAAPTQFEGVVLDASGNVLSLYIRERHDHLRVHVGATLQEAMSSSAVYEQDTWNSGFDGLCLLFGKFLDEFGALWLDLTHLIPVEDASNPDNKTYLLPTRDTYWQDPTAPLYHRNSALNRKYEEIFEA